MMNRTRGDAVKKQSGPGTLAALFAAAVPCRIILAAMLAVLSPSLAAEVQLQLDRARITEGETVTLTFLTDDAQQSLDADFSALEQDFLILDRRSETQLSIVNGRQTAVLRLLLTVEPRRSGLLTIPSIDFGNVQTKSVKLQVDKAPELEPGALPPVFIEVEIMPEEGPHYVHAQLGLIVRVFYQQNLTEAAISQPEPSLAAVRLLQETPYQAERGGERYRVLERSYAIFPERSGELILPPMRLSGRLVERRDGSIWQPTVRGRRIEVESETLQLQIEPRPVSFTGPVWQPARTLNVTQQVSSSDALRVGEPVTRTIIVDAVGLEENMIAEPVWPEMTGARIYPDQPQGISRDDGTWVLGHKEFRYAVVPEQEGELVLPELTIQWWDTINDRQQTAVLPAQTLYVQPSALVPPPRDVRPEESAQAGSSVAVGASGTPERTTIWRWLALLFAALWLLTLALYWRSRGGAPRASDKEEHGATPGHPDEADLMNQLRRACETGDRAAARRALLGWVQRCGPEANGSLLEFAARCGDSALRDAIYALDAEGFRDTTSDDGQQRQAEQWGGQVLWRCFEAWRQTWLERERQQKPALTDLYATANRL